MARLTKKQQDEIEAQQHEERIRAALRWTAAPERDVPPPSVAERGLRLTTGYTFHAYNRSVSVACSSSTHHAVGRTDRTTSQQPLALYSSRRLALQALRAALEREFAEALEKIDRQIEKEQQS